MLDYTIKFSWEQRKELKERIALQIHWGKSSRQESGTNGKRLAWKNWRRAKREEDHYQEPECPFAFIFKEASLLIEPEKTLPKTERNYGKVGMKMERERKEGIRRRKKIRGVRRGKEEKAKSKQRHHKGKYDLGKAIKKRDA